jgi:hypothetical protein
MVISKRTDTEYIRINQSCGKRCKAQRGGLRTSLSRAELSEDAASSALAAAHSATAASACLRTGVTNSGSDQAHPSRAAFSCKNAALSYSIYTSTGESGYPQGYPGGCAPGRRQKRAPLQAHWRGRRRCSQRRASRPGAEGHQSGHDVS